MKDLVPLGRSAKELGNQTAPHFPGSAKNLASAGLLPSSPERERERQHETRREHEGHTEDEITTSTKKKKRKGSREDKYDSKVINGHRRKKMGCERDREELEEAEKRLWRCHFVIVRKCQRLTVACERHSPLQTLTTTDEKRPAKRRKRSQTEREEEQRLKLNSKLS